MLRDLLIGGVIGGVLGGWQVFKQGFSAQPECLTGKQPTLKQHDEQAIADLYQQLAQVKQELAAALAKQAEAETQCAELNQLATDRAIELIQLQADQAELIAKVAELSQKRTRKKRSPKSIEIPPEMASVELENEAEANGSGTNGAAFNGIASNREGVLDAVTPFALNLALVEEKQIESTAATQLLQSVFVEEGFVEERTAGQDAAAESIADGGMGLDAAHANFLHTLAQQSSWSRESLLEVSGRLDLLLDGALEIINEVAFDRCDEPLTDGENPIEVNPRVLQELLS